MGSTQARLEITLTNSKLNHEKSQHSNRLIRNLFLYINIILNLTKTRFLCVKTEKSNSPSACYEISVQRVPRQAIQRGTSHSATAYTPGNDQRLAMANRDPIAHRA